MMGRRQEFMLPSVAAKLAAKRVDICRHPATHTES